MTLRALIAASTALLAMPAMAQELPHAIPDQEIEYSPYLQENFPNQVFFGDTHLHTAFSADAGLALATTTPDDAYRFAKGEEVISSQGLPARLQRPLDFLVVADHSENLGIALALNEENPILDYNEWSRTLAETYAPGTIEAIEESYVQWFGAVNEPGGGDPMEGSGLDETMWSRVTEAAERHNQPGTFTAFIGYEWTSGPDGNNLHRNVIFRDGKELADQVVPFSTYDSDDPEDLWQWMADYEELTGGRLLAIPHNGNLSNGLMFDDVTLSGEPLSADYAERRQRWEPIYEVTQIKGDGEAHPMLSPTDEFADYYTWDKGSFGEEPKTPEMLPREYARAAWKRGMAYEAELGVNPFKMGVVGSTDSHTGLSTAQENNFFGKVTLVEPTADPVRFEEYITGRFTPDDPSDDQVHGDGLAAGLAAVWARENTREALWDAMKRKETFATTGTRMRVRVFGGFGFDEGDIERSDFAAHGYGKGVPMGGDLSAAPDGAAPGFLIRAIRDPDGANLDRVQIIKGWTTPDGTTEERVYDVVWSDDREPGADGKLPAVGNTVDVAAATYTNSIGEPFLQGFWQDPDFDPSQRAFYYVRVLEIPTPSWLTYDAAFFGVEIPEGKRETQQERAYTSPIWYTPEG
ncbi:DUF3604 domain-containing protein [Tropicimonas sp. IMCC6043]|uniref:DUF3604 domain-containing protein n=1 Tax=Tropicimonas sp. IMCC6043 TaxID=2510645 RepID=UPI00101D5B39|nr:DUF3604 domain-containing protein [Tropicimonas sp. IMCC6043]RYH06276.1 DUF3604 domain-containing protein [Tropicimonas sp. IMCC6043]